MIRIVVSIENEKGDELFADSVTLTDDAWPPELSLWRKACKLVQHALWEAHPTYNERQQAFRDYALPAIEDSSLITPEYREKSSALLEATMMERGGVPF